MLEFTGSWHTFGGENTVKSKEKSLAAKMSTNQPVVLSEKKLFKPESHS